MGQSKGGGYTQKPTTTPGQQTFLDTILPNISPQLQQAAQGYAQFLPGGGGGEALQQAAQQNFQQQTIPNILNSFGSGSKGSSALNQALASGGANLNTNLGAILAQLQLQASQGLGSLGLGQAQAALTPQFAYLPNQPSRIQGATQGAIAGGAAGAPLGPWGAAAGAGIGAAGAFLMAKSSYNRQFRSGAYPVEHWDESTRVNGHEPDSPSKVRRRQGVARGSQTEANPGMVGKNDYKRKK